MRDSIMLHAIRQHAVRTPDRTALRGAHTTWSYQALADAVLRLQQRFARSGPAVVALCMDNDPAWAMVDLAVLAAGGVLVPVPGFFSEAQQLHVIRDAGVGTVVSDQPIDMEQRLLAGGVQILNRSRYLVAERWLTEFEIAPRMQAVLPVSCCKLTYTSGTTGNAKGVCLDLNAIEQVVHSLLLSTAASAQDEHLSVLPLSTLLENLAGLYVPLMAGASVTLLPGSQLGLPGASHLEIGLLLNTLRQRQPSTLVLTPELLKAVVQLTEAGHTLSERLRFIAVGGATVAVSLLERAEAVGLPVYEGYGLSECASVVALNTMTARRPGSVGKPLPHVRIRIAADGEIMVSGATMLGYNGLLRNDGDYWPTGDLGYLDTEGYLHIHGRKKHMFITSFGRNVSPEWVESQLVQSPEIAQAALFGEARPCNVALIVAASGASDTQIDARIQMINAALPDYARVTAWRRADAPFSTANQQLTANFRLRRDQIWQAYQNKINALYEEVLHEHV